MDDRFLYQLREEPDPEFVRALRRRFQPVSEPAAFRLRFGSWGWRWVAAPLATLLALTLALFALSPGARALLQSTTVEVAGRIYTILDAYPEGPDLETRESKPEIVTAEDALANSPYSIHLPTYAPPGYEFRHDRVLKYAPLPDRPQSNVYYFIWRGPENNLSLMTCGTCPWEQGEAIAPDAVEEVTLANGQPAVLVRGGWYLNEHRWRSDIMTTLTWRRDNVLYQLLAPSDFPVDELIRMASSTFEDLPNLQTTLTP